MRESQYQKELIDKIRELLPECVVIKNPTDYIQGLPDLLVLYKHMWAMLEVKPYETAAHQPNQDYYVQLFDDMSFAAFIFPENEEQVLYDLQQAFGVSG